MDMGERIKHLRQSKGLTQEELGAYIGVKKAAIMKYEKGNVKNMKRSTIETLSKLFEVSPSYLMCLDEPKLDEFGNPVLSIPILGTVKAGYDYLAQENIVGTLDIPQDLANSGDFFALKVKGDSMFPTIIEDDYVIVKKQDDFENGDIVVAIVNGDEATIKKGKKSDAGILLQPLNTNYEPLIFTYDEMKSIPVIIVGIVKRLEREF